MLFLTSKFLPSKTIRSFRHYDENLSLQGSVAEFMSSDEVIAVAKILLKLLELNDWQVRHGGLLGVGVNKDVFVRIL